MVAVLLDGSGACDVRLEFLVLGGRICGMLQEVGIVNFVYGNIHIDSIEEWAGEFFEIVFFLGHSTSTNMGGIAGVAAWTRVHGGDKHKITRVVGFAVGARDGDIFVFKGLTKGLEDMSRELGDFVKEQNALVSKRNLSWRSFWAAAND